MSTEKDVDKGFYLVYPHLRIGILFRLGSCWVGFHYAKIHKRVCINLLPCVTIWIVGEGGDIP